jgi:uncharacterized protein (DUF2267 family)
MSMTGLPAFDSTLQTTNVWLKELSEEMLWGDDRPRAYHALRAVLHALRDRLPIDEVVTLGAQLPMLVRGFYYEGWRPADKPLKARTLAVFLDHVAECMGPTPGEDPQTVTEGVFGLLSRHVSAGEMRGIMGALPHELRGLFEPPSVPDVRRARVRR